MTHLVRRGHQLAAIFAIKNLRNSIFQTFADLFYPLSSNFEEEVAHSRESRACLVLKVNVLPKLERFSFTHGIESKRSNQKENQSSGKNIVSCCCTTIMRTQGAAREQSGA